MRKPNRRASTKPRPNHRAKKRAHELRVDKALNPRKSGWSVEPQLRLITNGTVLMAMLGNSMAYLFSNDHPDNDAEREVVGRFLQSAQDWSDISRDIGAGGQVDAAADLHAQIMELGALGFIVFAGTGEWFLDPTFAAPAIAVQVVRLSSLGPGDVAAEPDPTVGK